MEALAVRRPAQPPAVGACQRRPLQLSVSLRRLLLGICLGATGRGAPLQLAAAGIEEMMKDIGAYELTPEMMKQAEEEEAREKWEADRAAKEMEKYKDPTDLLKKGGLDLTDEQAAKIKGSPEKVQAAMDETISEAYQTEMYQQRKCEVCKAVAKTLTDDLQASWKPAWSEERLLSHIQQFCESSALPGEYQLVPEDRAPGDEHDKYNVERDMKGVEIYTTKYSEKVFRRVCREDVDENDLTLASIARAQGLNKNDPWAKLRESSDDVKKAYKYGDFLFKAIEPRMCKKKCGKKKTKPKDKEREPPKAKGKPESSEKPADAKAEKGKDEL